MHLLYAVLFLKFQLMFSFQTYQFTSQICEWCNSYWSLCNILSIV